MEKPVIYKELIKVAKKKPVRFHMPGNKGHKIFSRSLKNLTKIDFTELSFSDDLGNPCGIIKRAQDNVAKTLGVKESFFLTDGSTSGVYSIIYAVKDLGKKLIINRNAHKSVFNALRLFNIQPIFIEQERKDGLYLPPKKESLETLVKEEDVIGAFLTYPDYYGLTFNLKEFSETLKKHNKLLLLDNAHGGHLRFVNRGIYAGEYADAFVDGVHKTMPALTQGAILSVNNESLIESVKTELSLFRTSSPSYPIMASIEFSVYYMENNSKRLNNLIKEIEKFKKEPFVFMENDDIFKIVIDFGASGYDGKEVACILENSGIYFELFDGRRIVFMLSVMSTKKDLRILSKTLKKIQKKNGEIKEQEFVPCKREIDYLTAVNAKNVKEVCLKDAVDKIFAENVGLFPPCFPLVIAGERANKSVIEILEQEERTFGIIDGKVKIIV